MERFVFDDRQFNVHRKDLQILNSIKLGKFKEYFSFTTVRNPFSRMVSVYHYYMGGGNNTNTDKRTRGILHELGFGGFIKNLDNLHSIIPDYSTNFETMAMQQIEYMCDGNFLLDRVFYFENLAANAGWLAAKYSISKPFPHQNASTHNDYKRYYDDELKDIIYQKYAIDIKLFYPHLIDGRI